MASQSNPEQAVVAADHLTVTVGPGGTRIVDDASFTIMPGSMLALVGESGSGKTMAARAVLGLLPTPLIAAPGSSIRFRHTELVGISPPALRKIRGEHIGMVFQEPMVSLNPSMTIGRQMAEGLALHHRRLGRNEIRERCLEMLKRVSIPNPVHCLSAYPHEFSGGMRQRIMLASVMLLKPDLLIADEPTTALDTLVQRDVLDLMVELTQENGTAVLLISHDLGMVSHYVRDVAVMLKGRIVEQGRSADVLSTPKHEYTQRLVDALPRRSAGGTRLARDAKPLVELRDVVIDYPGRARLFGRSEAKRAVDGVSLTIGHGETLALVGGSGSGKTTLGRATVGLIDPSAGSISFRGGQIVTWRGRAARLQREEMQIIFQDPYSSLDPRQRVGDIVAEPLRLDTTMERKARDIRVRDVLDEVGLSADFLRRLPHQLSGGQRQRVAIARAIARRPAFVVADEPVSALDMTVQKQILTLIRNLQDRYGFACLFVSHDLGAVEQVADRVAVMQNGKIVEIGSRDDIFDRPQHDYTKRLLNAAMLLDRRFDGVAAATAV
ncbi:dipeptide ABC transporter ATP-binding protein [Bradyrhizobium neotropicale]|uniref:dipeptide ABC transporter ATP-binding protein n=1 Tax=Bradyrhizobium neotropicale TaxID=1497615 RepID=UPI001AD61D67|nr:dipeptide ABC transporter ATP-binding protein [Bradyrhizobium neotropicale]MBO4223794.1 dipeptide ABC transporter ATP-binding protein [Bradyrhizobium neotropicale]